MCAVLFAHSPLVATSNFVAAGALIFAVASSGTASRVHAGVPVGHDVVINEIHYAPSASPPVNSPLRYEYVELYNRGQVAVSIGGWVLRDLDSENNYEQLYVFPTISLPASAFVTVCSNAATGNLAEDSDLSDGTGLLIAGAWSGSAGLNNAGDAVDLYTSNTFFDLVDFVYYDEANTGDPTVDDVAVARGIWINGAAIDTLSSGTTGRSIALRVDGATPNEAVAVPANAEDLDWMQYTAAIMGTPGERNSPMTGISGDYNQNNIVDAADYVMWKKNVGQPLGTLPNDNSGANPIGNAQYNLWKANFGNAATGATSTNGVAAVPEPTTFMLVLLLVCLGHVRLRYSSR